MDKYHPGMAGVMGWIRVQISADVLVVGILVKIHKTCRWLVTVNMTVQHHVLVSPHKTVPVSLALFGVDRP